MSNIIPSVGRKVWFYLGNFQREPHDATIIKVWGSNPKPESLVNLDVVDPNTGEHRCITSVEVGDEGAHGMHYRWMPYQQAQAAKHDVPPTKPQAPVDNAERIARVAHEVNRAYCQSLGDDSQPAWEDAPQWQRDSALLGVKLHIENPDAGPQASHASWMAQKVADGWVYGPEKKPELKQRHCIVQFDQLPREQQAKDYIFRGVVHALA